MVEQWFEEPSGPAPCAAAGRVLPNIEPLPLRYTWTTPMEPLQRCVYGESRWRVPAKNMDLPQSFLDLVSHISELQSNAPTLQ